MRRIERQQTRAARIVERHRPDIKNCRQQIKGNKRQKQSIRRAAGHFSRYTRYQQQRQNYERRYIKTQTFSHTFPFNATLSCLAAIIV